MEWGFWVSLVLLALALRERRLRRQAEPSLDLKRFFATAQERGYDFRTRGNPAALADELLRPRVRAALEAVASRPEAATTTILEDSDQRLAATVEGMRPLITLLNQLRDEIGEREDIKIEPAEFGHMALLDTRSSTHHVSMRFDYEPDHMQFRVERSDHYTFGDWNSNSDVKYASSPEEAFAAAIEAVGSHLGSERAHEVRRAHGGPSK